MIILWLGYRDLRGNGDVQRVFNRALPARGYSAVLTVVQNAKNLNARSFDPIINREQGVRNGMAPPLFLVRRTES